MENGEGSERAMRMSIRKKIASGGNRDLELMDSRLSAIGMFEPDMTLTEKEEILRAVELSKDPMPKSRFFIDEGDSEEKIIEESFNGVAPNDGDIFEVDTVPESPLSDATMDGIVEDRNPVGRTSEEEAARVMYAEIYEQIERNKKLNFEKTGMTKMDPWIPPELRPYEPPLIRKNEHTFKVAQSSIFCVPKGEDPKKYEAIIGANIEELHRRLVEGKRRRMLAERRLPAPWGPPVQVGRHMPNTIDAYRVAPRRFNRVPDPSSDSDTEEGGIGDGKNKDTDDDDDDDDFQPNSRITTRPKTFLATRQSNQAKPVLTNPEDDFFDDTATNDFWENDQKLIQRSPPNSAISDTEDAVYVELPNLSCSVKSPPSPVIDGNSNDGGASDKDFQVLTQRSTSDANRSTASEIRTMIPTRRSETTCYGTVKRPNSTDRRPLETRGSSKIPGAIATNKKNTDSTPSTTKTGGAWLNKQMTQSAPVPKPPKKRISKKKAQAAEIEEELGDIDDIFGDRSLAGIIRHKPPVVKVITTRSGLQSALGNSSDPDQPRASTGLKGYPLRKRFNHTEGGAAFSSIETKRLPSTPPNKDPEPSNEAGPSTKRQRTSFADALKSNRGIRVTRMTRVPNIQLNTSSDSDEEDPVGGGAASVAASTSGVFGQDEQLQEYVDCPICSGKFSSSEVQLHASSCGTEAGDNDRNEERAERLRLNQSIR